MAVINFRSHYFQYEIITGGFVDENGDFHEGEKKWSEPIKCNAVPNSGKANVINFGDGISRSYSYVCYFGKVEHRFSLGEKILLNRQGEVIELDVKGYQPYQLLTKIWV